MEKRGVRSKGAGSRLEDLQQDRSFCLVLAQTSPLNSSRDWLKFRKGFRNSSAFF